MKFITIILVFVIALWARNTMVVYQDSGDSTVFPIQNVDSVRFVEDSVVFWEDFESGNLDNWRVDFYKTDVSVVNGELSIVSEDGYNRTTSNSYSNETFNLQNFRITGYIKVLERGVYQGVHLRVLTQDSIIIAGIAINKDNGKKELWCLDATWKDYRVDYEWSYDQWHKVEIIKNESTVTYLFDDKIVGQKTIADITYERFFIKLLTYESSAYYDNIKLEEL